jgi:hypothetical protein
MRSADPSAYDQFVEITSFTNSAAPFEAGFRALMLTHSSTASVIFNIQQLVGGSLTTAKALHVDVGAGNLMRILPVSGETVYISSLTASAKVYALI